MQTHTLTPTLMQTVHDDGGKPVAEIYCPVLPVAELLTFRHVKLGHYLQQLAEGIPTDDDNPLRSCR